MGQGEVLGFLGPNGAGKTTTMKMVTGFLTPDSGTARICGHDIGSDTIAAQARLGYLPEGAPGLWRNDARANSCTSSPGARAVTARPAAPPANRRGADRA